MFAERSLHRLRGRDGAAFMLGTARCVAAMMTRQPWSELVGVLKMRFPHALGGTIGLDAAAIDSGNGETMEAVYRFAFPRYAA